MDAAAIVALEGDHAAGARSRPQLKGETVLSLRLMDDIQIPQLGADLRPELALLWPPAE
jgi:hypothetical protein